MIICHNAVKIIEPNLQCQQAYQHYIERLGDEERYPFVLDYDSTDFAQYIALMQDLKDGKVTGKVASSTFWLMHGKQILGVSNLRHYLDDSIREVGGHIGLGISPELRGQGLSKRLLQLTLDKAEQLGISCVHLHCYQHNLASNNMIRACQGQLDSVVEDASGAVINRYLIKVN